MNEEKNPQKEIEDLKKKLEIEKGKSQRTAEHLFNIAVREILERDYNEDEMLVTFEVKPNTKRTLKVRRPTHKELGDLLMLSFVFSNPSTIKVSEFKELYDKLPKLASSLCKDKSLDEEFWSNKVSSAALQNFILEVITVAQRGTNLTEEEINKFR